VKNLNLILLITYFIFRVVFRILIISWGPNPITNSTILDLCLYLIIVILLFHNKGNLIFYNINKTAFFILIISGFFPRLVDMSPLMIILQIIFWGLGGLLLYSYLKKFFFLRNLERVLFWSILGVIGGISITFFFTSILIVLNKLPLGSNSVINNVTTFIGFFITFLFSSVGLEEAVFRGFLWGTLREFKLSEQLILLLTACVFWLSHINYLNHPWTFWVVLPTISVFLSWIVYKCKMCSPSFFSHAAINATQVMFRDF
jgi:membrane protease YdiL (CAAX protease family)